MLPSVTFNSPEVVPLTTRKEMLNNNYVRTDDNINVVDPNINKRLTVGTNN